MTHLTYTLWTVVFLPLTLFFKYPFYLLTHYQLPESLLCSLTLLTNPGLQSSLSYMLAFGFIGSTATTCLEIRAVFPESSLQDLTVSPNRLFTNKTILPSKASCATELAEFQLTRWHSKQKFLAELKQAS